MQAHFKEGLVMKNAIALFALTTALLTFLYIYLTALIVMKRRESKILFKDGQDSILLSRIRAHANFAEYVPLILILMGIAILLNVPLTYLSLCAAATLIGRYAHAFGLLRPVIREHIRFRAFGMILTLLALLLLAIYDAIIGVMMFIY